MAIITISREMGSGGIPVAHKVAEKLGYQLIDGEMIMATDRRRNDHGRG
jgi:cytidylate kinase